MRRQEVRTEIEGGGTTDAVIVKARLELLLAEALAAAGRQPEAVEPAAESLRLLEEKGATYLAERARKLVAGNWPRGELSAELPRAAAAQQAGGQ